MDFIYTVDDALPAQLCDELVSRFEATPEKRQGGTGSGIDPAKKLSLDITIDYMEPFRECGQRVVNAALVHFARYFLKYPFFGSVNPAIVDQATGQKTLITMENRDIVDEKLMRMIVPSYFRIAPLNILKYKAGEGSYRHWHAEVFPAPGHEALHRVLFFVFYLNDVAAGGETELFFYEQKVPPRKGRLLIAPANFTHTHRGNVPLSNDKYILTSWLLFKEQTGAG
jgi:hypothetical protein